MKACKILNLVLASLLVLSLLAGGCGQAAEKATEKAMESAIERETGEKVDLDLDDESLEIRTEQGTLKAGSTYEWPPGMPADVPEFKYGTIIGVIETNSDAGKFYSVSMEDIAADSFDKYKNNLEGKVWTMELTQQMSSGG